MMKRSALLLLLLLAVINGERCEKTEGTHHVALSVANAQNTIHCGGSLIGDQWVLTAAHCDEPKLVALLNEHPDIKKIETGKIEETHKYVDCDGQHDIMLLKLKKPFKLPTIKLPDPINCRTPPINTPVRFAGRFIASSKTAGVTKGKSIQMMYLRCGDLEVTDCPDMSDYLHNEDPSVRSFAYDRILCAKDPNKNVDSCGGNSGGGMIQKSDGVLYGVVKGSSEIVCGGPVYIMDVCRYRAWIRKITGI